MLINIDKYKKSIILASMPRRPEALPAQPVLPQAEFQVPQQTRPDRRVGGTTPQPGTEVPLSQGGRLSEFFGVQQTSPSTERTMPVPFAAFSAVEGPASEKPTDRGSYDIKLQAASERPGKIRTPKIEVSIPYKESYPRD